MYQAAKTSKCSGDTAPALNKCFCGNGGKFITNTAKCLGQKDQKDVQEVYTTMSDACSDSDTPMSVSQSDFFKAANGDLTTTSTASTPTSTPTSTPPTSSTDPTATPTSTGDADESSKQGGLSTGATIGIAVGVSIAGVAAMAAIAFFLVRRNKSKADESHPMLAQDYKYPTPTTFPPHEPKSSWDQVYIGNPYNRDSYLTQASGSPDPRHQSFMTGSHYSTPSEQATQYVGPYAAPGGVAELAPDAAVQRDVDSRVFEMDGSNVSSLSQTTQGQRYEPYRPR